MNKKFALGLGLAFFVSLGCGDSRPRGSISGTVTKGGQPVTTPVTVSFNGESGSGAAVTDSSGKYSFPPPNAMGLPEGSYRIAVTPFAMTTDAAASTDYEAVMSGKAPAASNTDSTIPDKFKNFGTSDLKVDVKAGDNTYDVKLD